MTKITQISETYSLALNIEKTKCMIISKNSVHAGTLTVNQHQIKKVNKYNYLGTNVNDQWDHSQEIRCCVQKARAVFLKMANIFRSSDLTLITKMILLRCYIFSVLLYGAVSWTFTEAMSKKLEVFKMWLYRRILRISWVDHVTNDDVLNRMNNSREIMSIIKARKLEYLGHIMRNQHRFGLLQQILQGKILGKHGPG